MFLEGLLCVLRGFFGIDPVLLELSQRSLAKAVSISGDSALDLIEPAVEFVVGNAQRSLGTWMRHHRAVDEIPRRHEPEMLGDAHVLSCLQLAGKVREPCLLP